MAYLTHLRVCTIEITYFPPFGVCTQYMPYMNLFWVNTLKILYFDPFLEVGKLTILGYYKYNWNIWPGWGRIHINEIVWPFCG